MRNRIVEISLATGRWGAILEAESMGLVVQASRSCPPALRARVVERATYLYPSGWLLASYRRGFVDAHTARQRYCEQLERQAQLVERELHALAMKHASQTLVLMCFEKACERPCHRRWFADWWMERTGDDVPEVCDLASARQERLFADARLMR